MAKPNSKRYLVLLCTILFMTCLIIPVHASATDIALPGKPWNHVMIYAEDTPVNPNVIIIYLHGDCNSGQTVDDLEKLSQVHHPLKYHREETLPLPDDTVFICPQTHFDGEFITKSEDLHSMINAISKACPDAIIILAGHSRGAMSTYKIASEGNENVDGYVFISCRQPENVDTLRLIPNALVAYGVNDNAQRRGAFENLFLEHEITEQQYAKECSFIEEFSNNAYFVGPWSHPDAPQLLLEDFFWEWLNNITVEE